MGEPPAAAPGRRRTDPGRRRWYEAPISKAIGLLAGAVVTLGAGWFANDPAAVNRETVRKQESDQLLRDLKQRVDAMKCNLGAIHHA